jgi:hypothetical protein
VGAVFHTTLSRNGIVLRDNAFSNNAVTGIPATPATFRAVLDSDLTGVSGITLSTSSHTDLTMRYQPGTTVLPALDLNYQLATDGTNTSHQRVQLLGLRVGHASFDGIGSRSPITSVRVSVSFDGGATWLPAHVVGGNGFYFATWLNRVSAARPSLRVTAADANGDTIAQTITNAYTVGKQGER